MTQHADTKLHLEKLHNEKKDLGRKLKELRDEDRLLKEQLQTKQAELSELQARSRVDSRRPQPHRPG